jgi:hypothetical protein
MAAADSSDRLYPATVHEAVDISVIDHVSELGWSRGIYVGVSGNVVLQLEDDATSVTYVGLAAGMVHPFSVAKVIRTGTTATNIVLVR